MIYPIEIPQIRIKPQYLCSLFFDNVIQPGDAVCFNNRNNSGILDKIISRVSKRLLQDLDNSMPIIWSGIYSKFTHVGCVISENSIGEMYPPKARYRKLIDIPSGTELIIKRLKNNSRLQGIDTASNCIRSVDENLDYPESELLIYYLYSWRFNKITLGRKAADIFNDKISHTCAAMYMKWAKVGVNPNYWYPARLASDESLTNFVIRILVD